MKLLGDEIIESNGELTPEFEVRLQTLSDQLTKKTDSVIEWVKSIEDKINNINSRITELNEYKKSMIRSLENFNRYVVDSMDVMGVVKLEGEYGKISIRKPSQVLDVYDENKIPIEYISKVIIEETKIDTKKIKDLLKSGEIIDGAQLIQGKRNASFK